MVEHAVVIVAGGSGSRMKSKVPKQFIRVDGVPIIIHSIKKFLLFDPSIQVIVVLPASDKAYFSDIWGEQEANILLLLADGGTTRYQSVQNGLQYVNAKIVAIHDAVRPCVSIDTIQRCFNAAKEFGSGIPVAQVADSIRKVENDKRSIALNRSLLRSVQTPQVFETMAIKNAAKQVEKDVFTDDASVFESAGHCVHLVEGNSENIKITTPTDLFIAQHYLTKTV